MALWAWGDLCPSSCLAVLCRSCLALPRASSCLEALAHPSLCQVRLRAPLQGELLQELALLEEQQVQVEQQDQQEPLFPLEAPAATYSLLAQALEVQQQLEQEAWEQEERWAWEQACLPTAVL